MRIVRADDGTDLMVHTYAPAAASAVARPVLFAHANGFHGRVFEPMIEALGHAAAVWSMDLRGHGGSHGSTGHPGPAAESVSDWWRHGRDVLEVVDELTSTVGGPAPVGFGHSMGGVAMVIAELERPGTFAALALFEPVLMPPLSVHTPPEDRGRSLVDIAARRRERFASLDEAMANFRSKPPLSALHPAALVAYVEHGFITEPDGSVRLACAAAVESANFANVPRGAVLARLGELTCPVVLITATGMLAIVNERHAMPLLPPLTRPVLVRHPDLDHFGPLTAPAVLADDLRGLLSRLPV